MISKKRQLGLSLTEVFMVLIVGAGILLFSIRQYQSYRSAADVYSVKVNVDTLFQGLSSYYRANCYGTTDPTASTNAITAAPLNPNSLTPPATQQPIDIMADLITPGLLPTRELAGFSRSPIVNDSGDPTNPYSGYVLQFNQEVPASDRMVCVEGTAAASPLTGPTCTTQVPVGKIQAWSAQVAVLLKNPATAQQYKNLLGGDCLSSLAGSIVLPCSANAPGNYVVFMRQPSFASSHATSDYWVTNPTVKQFTQMYRTDSITALTDQSATSTQQYMCGN